MAESTRENMNGGRSGGRDEETRARSEVDKKPSTADKPDGRRGITFAQQDSLPKLPIPELEDTVRRYLAAVKPLQSAGDHEATIAASDEFLKGEGPILQRKLQDYATDKSNYIEQFWYDSYLSADNPVVLSLNPFFLLEDDPTPARSNQVTRAASLVVSALSFARAVRREELPVDEMRGVPLDMSQYDRIFATARIPTSTGCRMETDPTAKHIVVSSHGQLYWFDTLDHENNLIMTETDLALNLQSIIDDSKSLSVHESARTAIGLLSTEKRSNWASLRQSMIEDTTTKNAECLNIVDSALFVLCLDDAEPVSQSELCTNMLCGTNVVSKGLQIGSMANRWYDKLQIIVCKNGSAGINFEHTGVDGHTILRMASDTYTDTILRFARTINGQAPSLWASTSPDPSKRDPASFGDVSTTPRKLEWSMTPELSLALRFAETRLADLISQSDIEAVDFQGYGQAFIKRARFSPDAFVQMAFQAAYYGLYGRVESVYEPVMMKAYRGARTEAIRSATLEASDFVKKFWAGISAEQKIEALDEACQKHVAITKECSKGLGQDRHLYGLYSVWVRDVDDVGNETNKEPPDSQVNGERSTNDDAETKMEAASSPSPKPQRRLPSLFADGAWDKLNNTILSTSNCGNPSLRQFGFGPTSADGFGIGYIIKENSISICASSKHRQTRRFIDSIERYLLEIRGLIRAVGRGEKDAKASRARELEKSRGNSGRRSGEAKVEVNNADEDEEDLLGGYGFFDAGMLDAALKSQEAHKVKNEEENKTWRRDIGRKLALPSY